MVLRGQDYSMLQVLDRSYANVACFEMIVLHGSTGMRQSHAASVWSHLCECNM